MKITKIEKKKQLYLMEVDTKDNLYITEDTIVHFMLSKNKEISGEDFKKIVRYSQFSYGKNRSLYYLSFKPRTKVEMIAYLKKQDIKSEVINSIISYLIQNHFIDDHKYAENYIQEMLAHGDKGPYVIHQKLKLKGISPTLISDLLSDQDFSPIVQKNLSKALKTLEGRYPKQKLKEKLIQRMLSKGFSYPEIKEELDEISLEDYVQNEIELIEKEYQRLYKKYARRYTEPLLKTKIKEGLYRKGFAYDSISDTINKLHNEK